MNKTLVVFLVFHLVAYYDLAAQQLPDTTFHLVSFEAKYTPEVGPMVLIDAAHGNFHTLENRYAPFARLIKQDGFRVISGTNPFNSTYLQTCSLLVIANALNPDQQQNWSNPVLSAFSKEEINAVVRWIEEGGRLFLIADHMPFAGAAYELAKALGFTFSNGFVLDTTRRAPDRFISSEHTLRLPDSFSQFGLSNETDTIHTFTGQCFRIPQNALGILRFPEGYINYLPDTAWQFHAKTKTESASGLYQLAIMQVGKGRIVVSGEAAMFTAQLAGQQRMKVGMNQPICKDNQWLLLGLMRWLADNE